MIKRAALSSHFTGIVATYTKFPCDLGRTPAGAGWGPDINTEGSVFTPYTILNPQSASQSEGPFVQSQADWWLPYACTSYGVEPRQTENLADLVRTAVGSLQQKDIPLDDGTYYVQQVRVDSIGGLVRADVMDPPYWMQTDTVSIWVSKETLS